MVCDLQPDDVERCHVCLTRLFERRSGAANGIRYTGLAHSPEPESLGPTVHLVLRCQRLAVLILWLLLLLEYRRCFLPPSTLVSAVARVHQVSKQLGWQILLLSLRSRLSGEY
jgi:hypothetical protein